MRTWPKSSAQTYGLSGLGQWYPSANELNYLPVMSFSDVPNAAGFSYDSRTPIHGATTIFTIIDNVTKVYGKHTFKAGITIMRTRAWKGNQGNQFSGAFPVRQGCEQSARYELRLWERHPGHLSTLTRKPRPSPARTSAPAHSRSLCRIRGKLTRDLLWNWASALPSGVPGSSAPIESGFDPGAWNAANASVLYAPGLNATGSACRGQSDYRGAVSGGFDWRACSGRG